MVSDAANRRRRELALRQALGATRIQALSRLLRSTLTCVLVGLAIGVFVAVTAGRLLNLTLFGTGLANPWIITTVCGLILGVSLVACAGPAARAVRLDIGAELRQ